MVCYTASKVSFEFKVFKTMNQAYKEFWKLIKNNWN